MKNVNIVNIGLRTDAVDGVRIGSGRCTAYHTNTMPL